MKLVIGNQKAYLTRSDVVNFIEETKKGKCENVIVCPSSLYLDLYSSNSSGKIELIL